MLNKEDIRIVYLKTKKRVKSFLLSDQSREFFIFLFFFLVAGVFWLLQTLNNDYETVFRVPVRLKNVPDNVVITSEPSTSVQFRVKDKGTVLLNYMLGKNFYPVSLDFDSYQAHNNHVSVQASQYRSMIQQQLNASTQLLAVSPDTLEYIYSTGKSKVVPVCLQGRAEAAIQYYLADTIFAPDSVTVYAPTEELDTIRAAYTRPVDLTDIADTTTLTVPLHAPKGIKFVPAETTITFPVDMYTEKTVEVPIEGINFPSDRILRTFPSRIHVTFQVGLSRFRKVNGSDFHISVSYDELLNLGTDKYKVKFDRIPAGITNVRVSPREVDFLIEQNSPGGTTPTIP